MFKDRRAAVTGLGMVSAAGRNAAEHWAAVRLGKTAGEEIPAFVEARLPTTSAAPLTFDLSELLLTDAFAEMDRATQLAISAVREAWQQSSVGEHARPERIAVVVGTGFGSITSIVGDAEFAAANPEARLSPLAIPRGMPNATSYCISKSIGATGRNLTVSTACSSGNMAILLGMELIRQARADVVVVCGVDASLNNQVFRAWCSLRVMTTRPSSERPYRPFSRDRSGFLLGEGAGAVVLEDAEHARRRSAEILGYVCGGGTSCDAASLTRPVPEVQAAAIREALSDAEVRPEEIALLNAHGTATVANDVSETRAIQISLGRSASQVPVQASKPYFGHTMGASAILEFALILQQYRAGCAHPTPDLVDVDDRAWGHEGESHDGGFKGYAGAPGHATGRACIVRSPEDHGRLERGEAILITRVTTPAWTPLIAMSRGVVTEIGSPLSHAAIVCREYGIPCVIAVRDATDRIPDGSRIQVDGGAGRVTLMGA